MKARLRQYIIQKAGNVPPDLDKVLDCFQEQNTRAREVLSETGVVCGSCYFVVEGCIKVVNSDENGVETTSHLAFEDDWVTSMHSFVNRQPSEERLVCVEACQLLSIGRDAFERLSREVPPFENLYREILECSYSDSVNRIRTLMGMDALGRVRWLQAQHPLIFTRLSNRLLASYLGIAEATLSRLKAKL